MYKNTKNIADISKRKGDARVMCEFALLSIMNSSLISSTGYWVREMSLSCLSIVVDEVIISVRARVWSVTIFNYAQYVVITKVVYNLPRFTLFQKQILWHTDTIG